MVDITGLPEEIEMVKFVLHGTEVVSHVRQDRKTGRAQQPVLNRSASVTAKSNMGLWRKTNTSQ